jgi:hypothetical protein
MPNSARTRGAGTLNLASSFFGSFPSTARPTQKCELAASDRVCDGEAQRRAAGEWFACSLRGKSSPQT